MKTRMLRNLEVSAIGYGCMGFNHGYGAGPDKNDAIQLIRQSFDLGCTFYDTAEGYGMGSNEELVGEALKPFREKTVLATKFFLNSFEGGKQLNSNIRQHLEHSLKRLQTDYVDLYYLHRVNKDIPIEDVALCMGEFIREGKMREWRQARYTEEEIRLGQTSTPRSAIRSEYANRERMFEKDVIPACAALGIGFVPFSPLASGFLSGKAKAAQEHQGDDVRRVISRFDTENVQANQPLIDFLTDFATSKGATPAQISLAWMLHKENFIVPIPGMRRIERLKENLGAAIITLSKEEYDSLEKGLSTIAIHGNRTDEAIARLHELA